MAKPEIWGPKSQQDFLGYTSPYTLNPNNTVGDINPAVPIGRNIP